MVIQTPQCIHQVETTYLERHQSYSTDVRDEYTRHFLAGEFVTGQVRCVATKGLVCNIRLLLKPLYRTLRALVQTAAAAHQQSLFYKFFTHAHYQHTGV